jgi:ribosomal protein L11 methyltransferase
MEFEVLADADGAEALGDAMLEAGALAVSVEDAEADSEFEQPLFGEPGSAPGGAWRLNRLRVLLAAGVTPEQILARSTRALGLPRPAVVAIRTLTDQDWVRASQSQFAPVQVGQLWIVPTWDRPPDPHALNLRLDPGLAFGTGTHPSTRLCLLWLQAHPLDGQRVLDYGCGSGILAIAAARLGAGAVHGVDIDPLACRTALENSRRNGVAADYTAPDSLAPDGPQGRFDVVLANILAHPLIVLAPILMRHLAGPGCLVLAGVLARQVPELVRAYRAVDPALALSVWRSDGEWVCLHGQRQSST